MSLKIGMVGPSGSGKTMSALKFAKGLVGSWDKICLIDSENSGHLYSHLGDYLVLTLTPMFTLDRYMQALRDIETQCPDVECVIIDSISHGWDAEGGHLDKIAKMGGRFQDHGKAKPDLRRFLTLIQQYKSHIICTARTDTEWAVEKDERGKNAPIKVGTKVVFAPRFEYELTLVMRIEHNHYAVADKDRTDLFNNMIPTLIDETTGELVKKWNSSAPTIYTLERVKELLKMLDIDPAISSKKYEYAKWYLSDYFEKAKNKELNQEQIKEFIDKATTIQKSKLEDLITGETDESKSI